MLLPPPSSSAPEAAPPTGADTAEADTYVDPLVEQGLEASTLVFETANALLRASREGSVGVARGELKSIRKQALQTNRSFSQYVKAANLRENRLLVELHMIRQASYKDAIDRDANRARVYEYIRRYRFDEERLTAASSSLSTNPINAPSMAAVQVDRALSTVARIDAAIAQLSPTGHVKMHGAGLLGLVA